MTTFFKVDTHNNTERPKFIWVGNLENPTHSSIRAGDEQSRNMGMSALNAATDFFFLKKYEPVESGLHLYANPIEGDFEMRIGYVAQWYTGGIYPVPEYGWRPLIQRGQNKVLGDFNDHEHAALASRKHDAIDAYLNGALLKITVGIKSNFAEHHLSIWRGSVKDGEKKQNKALTRTRTADMASGRKEERERKYLKKPEKKVVIPADFAMPLRSGALLPWQEIPIGTIKFVDRRENPIETIKWTGNHEDLGVFVNYKRFGYFIQVPSDAN